MIMIMSRVLSYINIYFFTENLFYQVSWDPFSAKRIGIPDIYSLGIQFLYTFEIVIVIIFCQNHLTDIV